MGNEQLLTVQQVAEWLQVAPQAIYKWIDTQDLPCIKVSKKALRFDREEVKKWLEQQR